MDKYSWNFTEHAEIWYESADTIEECLAQAREQKDDDTWCVFIGENVPFVTTISSYDTLDRIEEEAYEFCELADSWQPHCVEREKLDELEEQLTEVVQAWLEKYNQQPDFWAVQNVTRYDLEERS
ncbi:hypothetical protein [Scatolibacter rhodanostii]|uniref:hypothetical protein n=1 Tax=Scatolibacter rhodanostii TaxID=2014781 RepID=UPI000C08BDC2|nr:hypothetical protein [Scatolibacter rhodanostii]